MLLDEPCAALDPLSINSLKEFILELKSAGLSILITDHNYWAIENILDKAYIIKGGEILVEGTAEKISKDKNAIGFLANKCIEESDGLLHLAHKYPRL